MLSDLLEIWSVLAAAPEARLAVFASASSLAALTAVTLRSVWFSLVNRSPKRKSALVQGVHFRRLSFVLCVAAFFLATSSWTLSSPRKSVVARSFAQPTSRLRGLDAKNNNDDEECTRTAPYFLSGRPWSEICTHSCAGGGGCYARVKGFCVSSIGASACSADDTDLGSWIVHVGDQTRKHRVLGRNCRTEFDRRGWRRGPSVVADATYQGPKSGHVYHEFEKVATVLGMIGAFGENLTSSTLLGARFFWFARRLSLTKFTEGILGAFSKELHEVAFPELRAGDTRKVCFEDAVLVRSGYGALTTGYSATVALRQRVLRSCGHIEEKEFTNAPPTVLVFDRSPPRSFANGFEIEKGFRLAGLHVHRVIGTGSTTLCEQIEQISDADIIITPHGSQHVLFMFAKRKAIIMEVQPFMYFNPGDIMFLRRAGIGFKLHESMGLPHYSSSMFHRLFTNFGWSECMRKHACRVRMRNLPVIANVSDVVGFVKRSLN